MAVVGETRVLGDVSSLPLASSRELRAFRSGRALPMPANTLRRCAAVGLVRWPSLMRPPVRAVLRAQLRAASGSSSKSTTNISEVMASKGSSLRNVLVRDVLGTPFSVRSSAILPLNIVESPRVKAFLPLLGHAGYFALASGFLMTDMLVLRCLLCFGYSGLVAFHSLHPRPLFIPLRWSAFFVAVNVGMAVQLAVERWPSGLSEEDSTLHSSFFDKLPPAKFKLLVDLGSRRTLSDGTRLTTEREVCDTLYFVERGVVSLTLNDDHVATIGRGGFVNDVAFQQGEGSAAYGSVLCVGEASVIQWDMAQLRAAFQADPSLAKDMKHTLIRSLVERERTNSKPPQSRLWPLISRARLVPRPSLCPFAELLQRYKAENKQLAAGDAKSATVDTQPAAANEATTGASAGGVDAPSSERAVASSPVPSASTSGASLARLVTSDDRAVKEGQKRLGRRRLSTRPSEMVFKEGLEGVRSRTNEELQRHAERASEKSKTPP